MGIWEQVDGKWKLKTSDRSYVSSQWANLDGKWYFLGVDGAMQAGTVTPDGYTVNENREWIQ